MAVDPDQRYPGWTVLRRALRACAEGSGAGTDDRVPTRFDTSGWLVGRDDELSEVVQAWRHARALDRPHPVVVHGESGMGKSALVAEAVDALGAAGVVSGLASFDLLEVGATPFTAVAAAWLRWSTRCWQPPTTSSRRSGQRSSVGCRPTACSHPRSFRPSWT